MKIFSYSSCGTCRKALSWLQENNFEINVLDILKTPPSKEMLIKAAEKLGHRKYLYNTSGKRYREIGADKIKLMSDHEVFELFIKDPKLIKRPFLMIDESRFLVGFKKKLWEEALLINTPKV